MLFYFIQSHITNVACVIYPALLKPFETKVIEQRLQGSLYIYKLIALNIFARDVCYCQQCHFKFRYVYLVIAIPLL